MEFSWAELKKKMQADLLSGDWRTKSYEFDGMKKENVTPEEFMRMFSVVEQRAADEAQDTCSRAILRGANR